jgi:hypothetical protein
MGPSFGNNELYIYEPMNGSGRLRSYVYDNFFNIPEKNGINQLTGDPIFKGKRGR